MNRASALEDLARGLEMAAESIRRLMTLPDPDEWLDQTRSPLGRRRHCELARAGKLAGARKLEGRWLVRRKVVDEYVELNGVAPHAAVGLTEADVLAFRAPRRRRRP